MRSSDDPGTLDILTGGLLMGYARVSTDAQDLLNQKEMLATAGSASNAISR